MSESKKQIRFYNRLTGEMENEDIYGETSIRLAYYNPIGKIVLKLLIKNPVFSRWYGKRMDKVSSKSRVLPFIKNYEVDVNEFALPPPAFATFNEFFYRKLKKEARPIDADESSIVLPADGRHLGFQNICEADTIYAKGQKLSLDELLGGKQHAEAYYGSSLVISRLCPVDYHRFHFPVDGVPEEPRLIEGPLYSVSPLALCKNIGYLINNRRWIIPITRNNKVVAILVVIGATCVGSAEFTYRAGEAVSKGNEVGFFKFGGSCVITLLSPGIAKLDESLIEKTKAGIESYDKMGRVFAEKTK